MTDKLTRDEAKAYLIKAEDPALVAESLTGLLHELVGDKAGAYSSAVEDLSGDADGDRDSLIDAIVESCQTPAFLTPLRVVLVRDVGRFTTEQVEPLLKYLADPLPTTILVLVAGGGQTAPKLNNALKKVGHVIDANPPKKDRSGWVKARAKESGLKFDGGAERKLVDHLGEDVGRVGALMQSLVSSYGAGATISADELEPFLGDAGGLAPWDLTDALDQGRVDDALVVLHRMLGGGDRHPLVVMVTLNSHYMNMLRLDGSAVRGEADAAELLGIHAFRAKKALAQGRRIGSEGVAEAIGLLAQADLDLRGDSELPDVLVLELLVARLSRLSRAGARSR